MMKYFLSTPEFRILKRNQSFLENRFKVILYLPESESICESDTICATVSGSNRSCKSVMNFLKKKINKLRRQILGKTTVENGSVVITLDSDFEDEYVEEITTSNSFPPSNSTANKKTEVLSGATDATEDLSVATEDLSVATDTTEDLSVATDTTEDSAQNENECKVSSTVDEKAETVSGSLSSLPEFIPLSSPTESQNPANARKRKRTTSENESLNDSITVISHTVSSSSKVLDIIELDTECEELEESVVLVEDKEPCPPSTYLSPPNLRPIVIDGSNVARAHGQITKTFSCKGIKLCVDYFLQKGHPLVVAFVPNFRRHCRGNTVPTTDQNILEELAESQHVVFTPSRRVNGKMINAYDDRFIVEYASTNGGVILSNDNFRDLIEESESFKETIEKRLLLYCFVRDQLMIPKDPLGRNGPPLQQFLSFPPS